MAIRSCARQRANRSKPTHPDTPGSAHTPLTPTRLAACRQGRSPRRRVTAPADLLLTRSDLIQVSDRLLNGGRPADAAAVLRSLPGGSLNADELASLAEAEQKRGHLQDAQRHAVAALQDEPDNKRARDVVGKIFMARRPITGVLLDCYTGKYGVRSARFQGAECRLTHAIVQAGSPISLPRL